MDSENLAEAVEEMEPVAWMVEADWKTGGGMVRPWRFYRTRELAVDALPEGAPQKRVVPLYSGHAQEASGE